jgi:1-phosphofructokinase
VTSRRLNDQKRGGTDMDADADRIALLAPAVYISITIEQADEGDDIHLHAGGQALWVARVLRQLGHRPVACAPVGGEAGRTLLGLIGEWGVTVHPIQTLADTPAYVHDRRGGERVELARSSRPTLRRHELDELYSRFLEVALEAGRCVVTGPEQDGAPKPEFFRRLGQDLNAAGVAVVADLHGEALDAFLDGGPITVLKVSTGDLVADGRLTDEQRDTDEAVDRVTDELVARGVHHLVVSRGRAPMLATEGDTRFRVSGPELETVDTKGSGDSMTAALASSLMLGLDTTTMLARAWAAGAANVTRHGLGSANAGLIDQLTIHADVVER